MKFKALLQTSGKGKPLPSKTSKLSPLASIANAKAPPISTTGSGESAHTAFYYTCMYRKKSNKKHKSWEGDGVLITNGPIAQLKDSEGKDLGRASNAFYTTLLGEGAELSIGGKDVEITGSLNFQDYASGKVFLPQSSVVKGVSSALSNPVSKKFKPLVKGANRVIDAEPKHNPNAPNALIMPGTGIAVVVDPILSRHLRPHQREGVKFLYECTMNLVDFQGCGAILADEMGLGKTLQSITLIWTLLKQNPVPGPPVAKRVLIICPATLVSNWEREFNKWIGSERIRVSSVTASTDISQFSAGRVSSVLLCSYERMRACIPLFQAANFDLVVCDEGHRLKNREIATSTAADSIPTRRRVVLTGTPIQNDLVEFFSMCDFVNPGVLGSLTTFKRVYEDAIVAGRAARASADVVALGKARMDELGKLTRKFILRRTESVNEAYLPAKSEVVLFCKMEEGQKREYIKESTIAVKNLDGRVLEYITKLKKIVNSDLFVASPPVASKPSYTDLLKSSGKIKVLAALMREISVTEKVVLVSNYTKTLDLLEIMCKGLQLAFVRLDGKTAVSKRQVIIDNFNKDKTPVFLLSSKAGGVGINLVGASRLILFDIDWNPSVCKQAMARIWRDGQTKPVVIYRMLTTGSIEERIYQRQLGKVGLSESVIDDKISADGFSKEELKDLFTLNDGSNCLTHDLLECQCLETKNPTRTAGKDAAPFVQLLEYEHIGRAEQIVDPILAKVWKDNSISFAFCRN